MKAAILLSLCVCLFGPALLSAAEPLRLVESIPLADVVGRIDHMAADPAGQRLFVAALGNNTLEVVDLTHSAVVKSIGNLYEPQGVGFLADRGLIVVANGGDGACQFFDGKTYELVQTVSLKSDADNVRCDPATEQVYVGFGSGALAVLDHRDWNHVAEIKLAEHPESFQLESQGTRIFVNVPKASQVAVVDRRQKSVVAVWPVTDAAKNYPMALDEPGHRLFVGCRLPPQVLVYDTQSGKVTDRFPCVGDADDLFYDRETKRLYVAGGEGFITVHQDEGTCFTQLAKIATAPGARTALFVPSLARLYLAVPRGESHTAELRVYEVVR